MALAFIKPGPLLAPYIDRYWLFNNTENGVAYMPQVPPGVGMDLFIHLAEPFTTAGGISMPPAHIIFSGEHATHIAPSDNIHFIAIRFRAGALKNFTAIPLYQLPGSYASVENLWGTAGNRLLEKIKNAPGKEAAIYLLERFLAKELDKNTKATPAWNCIIDHLYHSHDSVTIDLLAKKWKISNRHFRRKFTEETGFTPKHFQRLARFHATIKPLLLNKEKAYLSTALDQGFFDQTHFIKDFKYFMDCTPSAFFRDKNFMSHFYYPSL